jgi:hypothetical protein
MNAAQRRRRGRLLRVTAWLEEDPDLRASRI